MRSGIGGVLYLAVASLSYGADALVSDAKVNFNYAVQFISAAAEKMPAAQYSFRPSKDVRTFGQQVAHIAETQYVFCGPVRGDTYAPHHFEEKLTSKAEIAAALKAALAYCQEAWSKLDDANLGEKVEIAGQSRTMLGVLDLGTAHAFEHYGNMVTYLRMKGIVPPSSEEGGNGGK